MSTALAIREEQDARGIHALGERASSEHAAVKRSASDLLTHAINAGQAILSARELLKQGQWKPWLEEHGLPEQTAMSYAKIAYYRDELFDTTPSGQTLNISRALLYLRGFKLPALERGDRRDVNWDMRAEVRRLRKEGESLSGIARRLGIAPSTVKYHLKPDEERRKRNQRKAKNRLEREQAARRHRSEQLARRRGGQIGDAYAHVRKAAAHIQGALAADTTGPERIAYNAALAGLYAAEDALGNALAGRLAGDPRTRKAS